MKMLRKLVVVMIAIVTNSLLADTQKVGGYTWTYRINGYTAEIYKEDASGIAIAAVSPLPTGSVAIPSTLGGKPVTSIGEMAFSGCSGLTGVTIPNSVTSIDSWAFNRCSGLMSISVGSGNASYKSVNGWLLTKDGTTLIQGVNGNVTIPDSVTSIGDNAFSGLSGLMSVTIPNSVTSIGAGAFQSCGSLASVMIGNGVTSIGGSAFYNCSGLTSVTIPNSVTNIGAGAFHDCSGLTSVTIPKNVTSIGRYAFSGCSGLTSVLIPDSVTSIGYEAFYNCSGLASVTIPNSVTSIEDSAFQCSGLTSVTIPKNVTSIGRYAFSGCSGLTSVTIPDSVRSIGDSAFSFCNGLASVTIGDGVTSIGQSAFSNCSGLTSVTIGNSVTSIGWYAFYCCTNLTSVTIPDGVKNIREKAFYGCRGLTSVTIPDSVTSIASNAFYNCGNIKSVTVSQYVLDKGLNNVFDPLVGQHSITSVTYSGIITRIGRSAFSGCTALTNVRIPDSVTSIGDYAFWYCESLKSLTIPNSVTNIGEYAFAYCSRLSPMYVPVRFYGKLPSSAFFGCDNGRKTIYYGSIFLEFDANGGTGGSAMEQDYDTALIVPAVTRTGYTLTGWTPAVPEKVPPTNATYTAQWQINQYTMTFDAVGGTGGKTVTQDYGTSLTAPTVTRTGYTFTEWLPAVPSMVPAANTTYTAQWQVNQYAVTFDANGGTGSKTVTQDYGTSLTPPTVTRADYTFTGWSPPVPSTVPAGNATYVAQWKINQYTATFDANGGTGGTTKTQDYGTSLAAPTVTRTGYMFTGWSPSVPSTVPAGDATYTAQWKVNQYMMTFDGKGGGLGEAALPSVTVTQDYGSVLVAPTAAREWHDFIGWSPAVPTTVPADNVTYTAQWRRWGDSISAESLNGKTMRELYPDDYAHMTTVILEEGIAELPEGFFEGCVGIINLTLPDSLETLGYDDLPVRIKQTLSYDGDGFMRYNGWLLGYCDAGAAALTLPADVHGVGTGAFKDFYDVQTVEIPLNIRKIGRAAFENCTYLDNMEMPDSVVTVGSNAFENCSYMQTISIGSGVRKIRDRAFARCASLQAVVLPSGVEVIGNEAFYNDWRMLSVSIPHSVTNIGENAFGKCKNITGVTVPTTVKVMANLFPEAYSTIDTIAVAEGETSITNEMFAWCSNVVNFTWSGTETSVGAYAFEDCVSLQEMVIPHSVSSMGSGVFWGCSSLREVSLSRSLTSIPPSAFRKCCSLDSLIVPAGVTSIGSRFFDSSTLSIYYLCATAPSSDAGAYSGATDTCVSYVLQESRGWDGPGSRVLPEKWNGHAITYWTPNQFDVEFDANGGRFDSSGGSTWSEQQITDTGYALPSTEPVRPGWAFDGWWTEPVGGAQIKISTRVTLTRAHAIYAHWRYLGERMTVRFNANGGTAVVPETQDYVPGQTFGQFPVPTRRGYEFTGWHTTANMGIVSANAVVETNMTLYAQWVTDPLWPSTMQAVRPILYEGTNEVWSVWLDARGGYIEDEYRMLSFERNTRFGTLPVLEWCERIFLGWSFHLADYGRITEATVVPASDMELFARWMPIYYYVRFNANGGMGTMTNQVFVYDAPQNLMPHGFRREGFAFSGWATTPGGQVRYAENASVVNLEEVKGRIVDLYAVWSGAGYSVRFDSNGGEGFMDNQTIAIGETQNLWPNVYTRAGYVFAGWATSPTDAASGKVAYRDGTTVRNLATSNSATVPLYAVWIAESQTARIAFDANGGSVSPDYWDCVSGSAVEAFPLPTRPGFTFAGWWTAKTGGTQVSFITSVTSSQTFYAHWTENGEVDPGAGSYIVTFNPNGGSVSPTSRKVDSGSTVGELPVPVRTGYAFMGWFTAAEGGVEVTAATVVGSGVTCYAHWMVNQYTVTFDANGGSAVAPITQDYGTAVVAPAAPTREGYTFAGWTPELPVTMPAENLTFTARWTKDPDPVTPDPVTPDPVTPDPVTPDPVTPDPVTPDPVTPDPVTPDPVTPDPVTPTQEVWTLSFDANGGSEIPPITQASGTEVAAPAAPTREGYTFAGWTPELPVTMPAENLTFTARWTKDPDPVTPDPVTPDPVTPDPVTPDPVTPDPVMPDPVTPTQEVWTLSFDANGGSEVAPITQAYGTAVTAPAAPTRTGYTFNGWSPSVPATMPAGNATYVAQWKVNQYTVTFDENGGEGGWARSMDYGAAISAPAVTRTGYTFNGWSPSVPATMPAGNATYVAQWTINQYTATFNANGGEGGKTVTQNYGTALSAPTVARTGYTFNGWSPSVPATMPAGNATYVAQWKANQYTVTFDANGGEGGKTVTQNYGTALSAPTVTRTGYTFAGWSPSVPATMPAGNATYVAQWKANQYTATFNANGGEGGKTVTLNYGTALSAPTVTRTGYTFNGWSPSVPATMPVGNATYVAQWKANQYTVTFDANGGEGGWTRSMDYGAAISAPAVTRTGYTFNGWSPSVAGTVPVGGATYTAQWKVDQYTVTFNANGGSGGKTVTQNYGAALSAPTVTRTGYTFNGWSPSVPSTVPAGSVTYTAQWTANRYTVTFSANGGSGGKTVTQDYGSALFVPTVTRTGYTFNGWSPSVPSTVPAGNVTYTAQWKINRYTVTFDANGGTGGKTVTQDYGTAISAPTVARTGYTFNGWSPSVPATMPAGNVTYVAQWKVNQYTVTFDANGGLGGTTRTVTSGAAVGELPVPTRKGYELVGWFTAAEGGAAVAASTVVTGNVTYYAQWMAYGGRIKDVTFAKAQTVDGVLYGPDGAFAGTVQLKAGKINKKKGTVSISASATLMDGKKITGKAVKLKRSDDGTLSGTVKFKAPIGNMHFEMEEDGTFTFNSDSGYSMTEGAVGGNLPNGMMAFLVDIDSFPGLPAGYDLLEEALPFEMLGKVSGGKKIDFGKAASVKYAKVKEGKITRYVLSGLNDEKKPNVPALKLTYTPKTGVFKGSFKIYATNEGSVAPGKKPTLKTYTVNVTGFYVGGVGGGQATLKKPAASWPVTLEFE